jgi:hypothetical protein
MDLITNLFKKTTKFIAYVSVMLIVISVSVIIFQDKGPEHESKSEYVCLDVWISIEEQSICFIDAELRDVVDTGYRYSTERIEYYDNPITIPPMLTYFPIYNPQGKQLPKEIFLDKDKFMEISERLLKYYLDKAKPNKLFKCSTSRIGDSRYYALLENNSYFPKFFREDADNNTGFMDPLWDYKQEIVGAFRIDVKINNCFGGKKDCRIKNGDIKLGTFYDRIDEYQITGDDDEFYSLYEHDYGFEGKYKLDYEAKIDRKIGLYYDWRTFEDRSDFILTESNAEGECKSEPLENLYDLMLDAQKPTFQYAYEKTVMDYKNRTKFMKDKEQYDALEKKL